jgi:hypothetical protein
MRGHRQSPDDPDLRPQTGIVTMPPSTSNAGRLNPSLKLKKETEVKGVIATQANAVKTHIGTAWTSQIDILPEIVPLVRLRPINLVALFCVSLLVNLPV